MGKNNMDDDDFRNSKPEKRVFITAIVIAVTLFFCILVTRPLVPSFITPTSTSASVNVSTPSYIDSTETASIPTEPSSTPGSVLPGFPWPPPEPSTRAIVPFNQLNQFATFKDVDWIISTALTRSGYDERSYFAVPYGFAVVTRLEQINIFGKPDYSNRWASELSPIQLYDFSLSNYLEALFLAPQGYYRVFVFIITSDIIIQSGTPVSQSDVQGWITEGANKLPVWMETLRFTEDHDCTVYVYEFIQSGIGSEPYQNIPSLTSGQKHLEETGIWQTLINLRSKYK